MQIRDPGPGIVIQDHISESVVSIFWVKNNLMSVAKPDLGSGAVLTLDPDPERKNSDPGSEMNIPDPLHCLLLIVVHNFVIFTTSFLMQEVRR